MEFSKEAMVACMGLIPGVGPYLGALASCLFPIFWGESGGDVWGAIRARVEAAINEKIEQLWNKLLSNDLQGFKDLIDEYKKKAAQASGGSEQYKQDARTAFWIARSKGIDKWAQFTDADYGWKTLPLFAQYANLRILLLRDAIHNAEKLGFEDSRVAEFKKELLELAGPYNAVHPELGGKFARHVMETGFKGLERTWGMGYQHYFNYQRIIMIGAFDFLPMWSQLSVYGDAPEKMKRDYVLWHGPYGGLFRDYVDWAKSQPWIPTAEGYEEPHLHGVYWLEAIRGFAIMLSEGRWQRTQGFESGEWRTFGPPKPDRLWLRAGQWGPLYQFAYSLKGGEATGWFGQPKPCHQGVDGFQIKKWHWNWVRGSAHPGSYPSEPMGVASVMFGFRPDDPYIKRGKIKPVSGNYYEIYCADTGQVVDLERYSTQGRVPVQLAEATASRSQQWLVEHAPNSEKEAWVLVNRYNGQYLQFEDASVGQQGKDSENEPGLPLPAQWLMEDNEDGTTSLRTDRGTLSVSLPARDGGTDRWLLLPSGDQPSHVSDGRPNVYAVPDVIGDKVALRITLVNPADGQEVEDWQLSLVLPVEVGKDVHVTAPVLPAAATDLERAVLGAIGAGRAEDAVAVQSVTEQPKGLQVHLVAGASGQETLKPGEYATACLVTEMPAGDGCISVLRPAEVSLNGAPVNF